MARPEVTGRKFITAKQLCARWGGVSFMFVERRLKSDPEMPRPLRFENGRLRFFDLDAIEQYERSKIKQSA